MSSVYDYIVIGSGLSGLAIASRLSQETERVLLLDSADIAGGWLRKPNLAAVPVSRNAEKGLLFLEDLTGIKIMGEVQEIPPVTFEDGGLKTFIGFGEKTPDFYDEMAYYCSSQYYELKASPAIWIQRLLENFKGTFAPRSIVTKFVVENDHVQHVLVNGTKKIQAHNFIYCGEVKSLNRLIPSDFISNKVQTRISKTKTWTRAALQIDHEAVVTENPAFHILIGTSQEEIVTCVGQFQGTTSTWMTFVSDEEAEDAEIVGLALKRIKRQIKRAYPDSLNEKTLERISVQPQFGGGFELKLNANQSWPQLENLWIGSGTIQKARNIVGALNQAQMVLSALGFVTTDLEIDHSTPVENENDDLEKPFTAEAAAEEASLSEETKPAKKSRKKKSKAEPEAEA
jgi:protoporphyrinogen oxidase